MKAGRRTLTVDVVRTRDGLAALHDDWCALFEMTPEVSGFQSHAWVETCQDHLSAVSSLFVGVVRDGMRPIAAFPTRLAPGRRLTFIGEEPSNYSGPVYDPGHLEEAVLAWAKELRQSAGVRAIDLSGLRERSPFFELIQSRPLPGWGSAVIVPTNSCPEVDLRPGWPALQGRHKSKQRSTWKRKATRLGHLGKLEFVETSDPSAIDAAMPRMLELFDERWRGQRIGTAFSSRPAFHRDAAMRLGAAELALVSMLCLDGELVAFSYGVRGDRGTSSYVLAHDDRFHLYSPGLLLLLRVLQAASNRGDSTYDFSLGEEAYKSLWVTGSQDVFRALWGLGSRPRAAVSRARVGARSVTWLRRLKRQGAGALLPNRRSAPEEPDAPGLPAGQPSRLHVYRVAGGGAHPASLRPCSYGEMRGLLSPRLLTLALERGFRGDELLVVEGDDEPLGVVWRGATGRRAAVTGNLLPPKNDDDVYYHPVPMNSVPMEDLVSRLVTGRPAVVVTAHRLPASHAEELGELQPDAAV